MLSKFYIACIACLFAFASQAFTPESPLQNPAQETDAQQLFHRLRCVVCEGQSLAESDATLARQMRTEIRRMLHEEKSPEEIVHFFQSRYGDTVLMSPPLAPRTYLLWAAPLVLLVIGVALLVRGRKS